MKYGSANVARARLPSEIKDKGAKFEEKPPLYGVGSFLVVCVFGMAGNRFESIAGCVSCIESFVLRMLICIGRCGSG